jgi:DNA polymerase-3 subunit epsilon
VSSGETVAIAARKLPRRQPLPAILHAQVTPLVPAAASHAALQSLATLMNGRCVFVDLETTGTSAARERITEVGIVSVDFDRDAVRVQEWSSLVNPQRPIPSEIQWLTGITNAMVRDAPTFAELADTLLERLRDAVFIAHNARFDYGFLKAEFARLGIPWRATTLCTVRLSRLIDPDRSPHTLDAVATRYGLDGEQRHRALGDARVLWRFLQALAVRRPPQELEDAVGALLRASSTPPMLPPDALDGIPDTPGVYLFYGLNAHPIYIGKSLTLRSRVMAHFSADHANAQDARLSQQVCRIEWEETAGDVGALLREAALVKTRLPAHNIALRRHAGQVLLRLAGNRLRFVPAALVTPNALPEHHGPFGSRAAARAHLLALAREHRLCLKTLGLERAASKARTLPATAVQREEDAPDAQLAAALTLPPAAAHVPQQAAQEAAQRTAPPAPCFAYQVRRCLGACVGEEPADAHAQRVEALLAPARIAAWPHEGAVTLIERRADGLREDLHVFDRWCWLGSVASLDAAHALAAADGPRSFDADVYRIVRAALARGTCEVVALGAG